MYTSPPAFKLVGRLKVQEQECGRCSTRLWRENR